jgi:long-subunit fatty acid transport protein
MEAILKKLLVTLIIIGIPSVAVYAQVSQTAVPFLLIAPGARAAGMGETFVAVADDATATHWNPAGLGRFRFRRIGLNYRSDNVRKSKK